MHELVAIGPALVLVGVLYAYTRVKRQRMSRAWEQGCESLLANDYATAERCFRACIKLIPTSALARRLLGRTLARQERFFAAEEQFRAATQLEPRNGEGFLDLGLFLGTCPPARPDEALAAFAKALKFDPALREHLLAAELPAELRGDVRLKAILGESGGE